jgi:putative MATE family efflux protein
MAIEPAAQAEQVSQQAVEVVGRGAGLHEERRDIARAVFRLAWPAIAENALQTLLGIVDTAVVARLGTAALSGVGASQQLIWVLSNLILAVSMGTTVLIARFTGARQPERANAALKQSLLLGVVVSLMLMPVGLVAHPMLSMLGLTPAAADAGATYLSITLFMSMPLLLMFVAGAALRGAGDTRTPMYVTGFINIINAILAVELVFGGVKASTIFSDWLSGLLALVGADVRVQVPGLPWVPEMGVAGSAWATVIARTLGAAILLSLFLRSRSYLQLWSVFGWRPNFDLMWRILRVGIPSALEMLFMSLGILVYSFIVIGMGEVVFATSRLVLNAVFLSQMPGFGFSMAATTLVGQSLGARQPHRAWVGSWLATRSALIWMSAMGVAFFFFGEQILRIFTDDPRLLALGDPAMKVVALSQPPLAVAFVLAGSLRGAGDVRFPMWVTTLAVWVVRLPTGAFLGLPTVCLPFTGVCLPGLGLGLVGIYTALIVESTLRAGLFFWRFRQGKWQSIKV